MTDFKELNKDFAYELMSIPTCSSNEYRLVTYIMLFAEKHGIKYQFDKYGNLYLTKGELSDGEFYPCMTAHVDAVQSNHKPYITSGENLQVQTRTNKDGKTEIYGDGYGLGGDDKCGVLIALSVMLKVDKMKASFFLEEEIGCKGSQELDEDFFDNVGYVIGFDSPDFNRSAWSVSGTQLFDKDFYLNHMKEICDKHGRTLFYSEPFTDLCHIREKVPVQAMNFGSGYYSAHTNTEYIVLEEVDDCISLALDLINHLKCERYELKAGKSTFASSGEYVRNPKTGIYERRLVGNPEEIKKTKEDLEFLESLGDKSKYSSRYGGYSNYGGYGGGSYGGYRQSTYGYDIYDEYDDYDDYYNEDFYGHNWGGANHKLKSKARKKEKTGIGDDTSITDERVLVYVIDKYEKRLQQLREDVEAKCQLLNIDFDKEFKTLFEDTVLF